MRYPLPYAFARGNQLLLSHDMGWYDPAQPGGGTPKPYTHLSESFLPKLGAAGVQVGTAYLLCPEATTTCPSSCRQYPGER